MSQDPSDATLTPLQRAFLALEETRGRLARLEQAAREPIAIVGLGCRVPGGGNDAQSFWRLLRDGVDAISPMPSDRWDADALYDPDPDAPGRIAARAGGFLRDVDGFDAGFFGIAPREAQGMDPQQRLLLEVAWEALEHAGQAPDRLQGSRTGVFVGACASDYAYLQLQSADSSLLDAHFTSGIAHSVLSGRLSYLLGLQGPSVTIDTACSSSLVAVHLACQSLRTGESRLALAGGVNLILSPDLYIALSHARMLAPDGRCKTFDAAADGFARAEGCGVVVLKKLSDARADGDRVLAVIRGSAVNQDGPSSSLTAPNGPAQEAVVREALAQAGVAPREVGYVEAHGTGTQLGDPLEVRALGAVFGRDRSADVPPLAIGSVKTNIGHLEAAAGVTGLIKLVLSLQHRTMPPHLHLRQPTPHIAWSELPLRIVTEASPWPTIAGRRIAGASSFGFSGTNAHVVVEEAPAEVDAATPPALPFHLMTLSASDQPALAALAVRAAQALDGRRDDELADLCHTANHGRAHFAQRAALVVSSLAQLREALQALAAGSEHAALRTGRVDGRDPPRVAFLYTGQGSQYAGMGRLLYDTAPVFRAALDRCATLLAPRLERPLLDVLFPPDGAASPIDETVYTQPALFALEYALTQLWASWGVVPKAVIGHSVGELVAACIAGVMSLEDALQLVAERGRLMQSAPRGGAMAAVGAAEDVVREALPAYGGAVTIAAANAPQQTVVSGAADAVRDLCDTLVARGVRCTPLTVSHAFHSADLDAVLDDFERAAAGVRLAAQRVRLVSNVTGRFAEDADITRPDYWRRHAREAVRFGDGLRSLTALHPDVLLEVGPHPTLLGFAGAALGADAPAMAASLRQGRNDWQQVLEAVGTLYLAGATIDWQALDPRRRQRIVDWPTYPFQRERYWFCARRQRALVVSPPHGRHPLLGARLRTAGREAIFESFVAADTPAFVREHVVQGQVVMPATAYLDALDAAAVALLGSERVCVDDVSVDEAMLLDDDGTARVVQLVCGEVGDDGAAVTLSSAAAEGAADGGAAWIRHVAATLCHAGDGRAAAAASLAEARTLCPSTLDIEAFYDALRARGLDFGAAFRSLRELHGGSAQALGRVVLPDALRHDASAWRLHPVLLDGCLQVLAAIVVSQGDDALYLPIGVGRYERHGGATGACWSHVRLLDGSDETRRAEVVVYGDDGRLMARLSDVRLKRVSADALARLGGRWLDDALYEPRWVAAAAAADGFTGADFAAASHGAAAASPALRVASQLDAYDAFLPKFEALCGQWVVDALRRLGWQPLPGERFDGCDALADRLGVGVRHRRLFARLIAILAEDGLVVRDGAQWRVVHALPAASPATGAAALGSRHACGRIELEFTSRVAAELASALRGERETMQLLFPGGSLETAERLYRDTPTARYFNGLLAEAVAALAAARPASQQPLRILEVGGGTGGTTAHLLPRLPADGIEYTFTDVGPLFVAKARERYAERAGMRFQVLDLERDPQAQGFEALSFDVVIASNVVHATSDLRRTLGRLRSLLRAGGVLAMLEVTAAQRWFDLTVGLTDGWWAFADSDLRTDYPTLSRERWLALLGECGFAPTAALPVEGERSGALALQSLLLAQRTATPPSLPARHWIVLADARGTGAALVARLRARGDRCTLVHAGDDYSHSGDAATLRPDDADHHRRLLDALRGAGCDVHGVVHAWSLDDDAGGLPVRASSKRAAQRGPIAVASIAKALVGMNPTPRLWIATRGARDADAGATAVAAPTQAMVWGVASTLAIEHPELRTVCCDLEPGTTDHDALDALMAELDAPGVDLQVAWRRGERRVARLARWRRGTSTPAAPWRLATAERGRLDRLERVPLARRPLGAGEVEIAVEATGLNFKDVLNVLGMYPGDPGPLGGECAGRVTAVGAGVTQLRPGDEVLAVAGGSFASHIVARAELVQRRPAGMSAEEGAAFPIAFLTAHYCLVHLADLRAGQSVLVHAAAGGVGMAAVRIAQRAGARVHATAGSPAKRDLLRALGVEHVYDSRSNAFADEILACTGGRGVDVVLNSLSGELIDAGLRCTAHGGCFVEIGKRGIKQPAEVDALDRAIRYHVVDWGETADRDPALVGGMLARLVDDVREVRLQTLPRHAFALDDAARAFRFMAQARHHGKIVVRHGIPSAPAIRRDGTYVVTGGLSGLGALVARWLAERGAGRIALMGRRGATAAASSLVDTLRALGSSVVVEALDVADAGALARSLARLRNDGPPLRGIVHSAGVLDDAPVLQQDAGRFERVLAPKLHGAQALDMLTRGDALDFFVLFSSVAGVLGSPGQANHAAANAYLDALALQRRSCGLPALSIDWGAWSDVGAAADRAIGERLAAQGLAALTPAQGLAAFERVLGIDRAQVAVLLMDWPRHILHRWHGVVPSLLAELAGGASTTAGGTSQRAAHGVDLRDELAAAPPGRRRSIVAAFVRERALRALGVDASRTIDPRTPLGDLGLDSLLAVELRNTLGTALGHSLPATLLFDHPTLDALTDYLLAEVLDPSDASDAPAPSQAAVATPADGLVDEIEDLSDDEVERRLAERMKRAT